MVQSRMHLAACSTVGCSLQDGGPAVCRVVLEGCSCNLARSSSGRGRRMTGSAFKAMDVVMACLSYEKGGGLEEGGLQIRPDGRAADDGKRF